jgi:hypothetical protein
MDFCNRMIIGRSACILKGSTRQTWNQVQAQFKDGNGQQLPSKTIQRHATVHNLIMQNSTMRFAWGYFDKLQKRGGVLRTAIESHNLQFGGPAPSEQVETPNGPVNVLPLWFCMMLDAADAIDNGDENAAADVSNGDLGQFGDDVAVTVATTELESAQPPNENQETLIMPENLGPVPMDIDHQSIEPEICAICQEEVVNCVRLIGVNCEKHHFCMGCIDNWFNVSRNTTCPQCREEVDAYEICNTGEIRAAGNNNVQHNYNGPHRHSRYRSIDMDEIFMINHNGNGNEDANEEYGNELRIQNEQRRQRRQKRSRPQNNRNE